MAITDYIVIACLCYFAVRGWQKGFMRSLLGPISLIVGWAGSYLYYQKNPQLLPALFIGIFGPLLFYILCLILLKLVNTLLKKDAFQEISLTSRLLGSGISLGWRGSLLALTLVLFSVLPAPWPWLRNIQNDVRHSQSFTLLDQRPGGEIRDITEDFQNLAKIYSDPEALDALRETREYKQLLADEKIHRLLSSPDLARYFKENDMAGFWKDPAVREVIFDPQSLKKLLAFSRKIGQTAK